jgi:hypothetical protein
MNTAEQCGAISPSQAERRIRGVNNLKDPVTKMRSQKKKQKMATNAGKRSKHERKEGISEGSVNDELRGVRKKKPALVINLRGYRTKEDEEREHLAHLLQLHRSLEQDTAMKLSDIPNYYVELEERFDVGDEDWSHYKLADADGQHAYTAIGEFGEDRVFVFDKLNRQVRRLDSYIPQTKHGRWWLACKTAETASEFARLVPFTAGFIFVKLDLSTIPSRLFEGDFRDVAAATVEAALQKHHLGECVGGEGESLIWFKVSNIELAATVVERTLDTCGLLKGASITDGEGVPRVFYPRHRRRVVTEWGY